MTALGWIAVLAVILFLLAGWPDGNDDDVIGGGP